MEVEDHDQIVLYPSGKIACSLSRVRGDRITSIFSPNGTLLLLFNEQGVGSCHYASGKPWLVTSASAYALSSPEGKEIERGAWPRKNKEPVSLEVNQYLTVSFAEKKDILATVRIGEVKKVFQCGEKLRREDSKIEHDLSKIRARQKESGPSGSIFVTPGPHHTRSAQPGIGALRSAIRSLSSSPLSETMKSLESLDERLLSIDLKGGGSGKSLSSLSKSSTMSSSLLSTMGRKQLPENFGSPDMTDHAKQMSRRPNPHVHKAARKRLCRISQKDALKGGESKPDELLVVFLTADWNPVSARIEAEVQRANRDVSEDAGLSNHIKMVSCDASEGSLFKAKYDVRSVPFFFFFFEGRLVSATNAVRKSRELKELAVDALAQGRKGKFLPDSFSFKGRLDNTSLDCIESSWNMLA